MKFEKTLKTEEMQEAVEAMEKELERVGITPEMTVRFRLSFEEMLILLQEQAGEGRAFTVNTRSKGGELLVTLSVDGGEMDPFAAGSPLLERFVGELDFRPVWEYRGRTNTILFRFTLYNSTKRNYFHFTM